MSNSPRFSKWLVASTSHFSLDELDLKIFSRILQKIIIAQMLSTGGEGLTQTVNY